MSTLHTLNKITGPSGDLLERCLASMTQHDCLLLQEDGVYAVMEGSLPLRKIQKVLSVAQLFCLEDDVKARGLQQKLSQQVNVIDYSGYVALTVKCNKVISWF